MFHRIAALALAAAALVFAGSAGAATISPVGTTNVRVVAPLAALGLGASPTGSATVDLSGLKPLFLFPITGGMIDASGNAVIQHAGSGVTLFSLDDSTVFATVGDFVIDTLAGTVSGVVNGSGPTTVLFNFGATKADGILLNISSGLAGALTSVFGAPDLTGAAFGFGITDPVAAPVPLPAGGLLLLAALGLVALGAGRRRQPLPA
jgi:hypothetical protein